MGKNFVQIGEKRGRLTIIGRVAKTALHQVIWLALCDCGKETKIGTSQFRKGEPCCRDCSYKLKKRAFKHGESRRTVLYKRWETIKNRCYCEASSVYGWYGARGIRMCDEWLNDFTAFRDWALANGFKPELTIDRIDPDGNYESSNCRWVTIQENIIHRNAARKVAA